MKKISLIFSIVFLAFTFLGAGYVLYTGGRAQAGYAVIPMIFALASLVPLPAEKGMKRLLEKEDGQRALPCGRREYQREEPPCF